MNNFFQNDLHKKELATKNDVLLVQKDVVLARSELSLKIEQSRNQMLLWMFAMLSLFAGFIFTVLAKGFHWF